MDGIEAFYFLSAPEKAALRDKVRRLEDRAALGSAYAAAAEELADAVLPYLAATYAFMRDLPYEVDDRLVRLSIALARFRIVSAIVSDKPQN